MGRGCGADSMTVSRLEEVTSITRGKVDFDQEPVEQYSDIFYVGACYSGVCGTED